MLGGSPLARHSLAWWSTNPPSSQLAPSATFLSSRKLRGHANYATLVCSVLAATTLTSCLLFPALYLKIPLRCCSFCCYCPVPAGYRLLVPIPSNSREQNLSLQPSTLRRALHCCAYSEATTRPSHPSQFFFPSLEDTISTPRLLDSCSIDVP